MSIAGYFYCGAYTADNFAITTRPVDGAANAELVRFLCGPNARWLSGDVLLATGAEVRRAAR
mgnify:CR=1 FL=1